MLMQELQSDLNASLKAGNAVRVEALRFLIAGVHNSVTAKYGAEWETKLTDADVVDVVKKQVKTHRESISAFERAGRQELVGKERAQLSVLEEFAPKELSDDDLKQLLAPIAASGEPNFGLLMKTAMAAVAGRADGGRVSTILRELMKK
ncbi:hypothetical protein A2363_04090 [Candidatus Gottesmanbacteria bacterium RIFOXYB1_FULL_47_11]|uniref:Glutamyl-tRNA amidotransferase n=1 Tax=Candidatus Gottesmanbacteria bacterium RIFOXYB1_FULL_47_11 TaxID=1798401 RepID=A0A1F6BDV0_9BACT|nr:MAG: hypothetical protein A2363_04090 [Candidatus Gottesmanbacteria bacterium RIFOXYB1_FULL_47_11]